MCEEEREREHARERNVCKRETCEEEREREYEGRSDKVLE